MTTFTIGKDGYVPSHDDQARTPGRGEVRISIKAVSLNHRDLLMSSMPSAIGQIPLSDGAGIVEEIGEGVKVLAPGDRVVLPFFRDWLSGPYKTQYFGSAFGGEFANGVLTDSVTVDASIPVKIDQSLSFEAAATLPCAAVTAWNGLVNRAGVGSDDTVLIQGTGGVALFALQMAVRRGARVIVISSSDEKLERAKAMGATFGINYLTTPNWDLEALALTEGQGVSRVLEVGGSATYQRSLNVVASCGKIIQIGMLTGHQCTPDLMNLLIKSAEIVGVAVGSREHLVTVTSFYTQNAIEPVIDRVFAMSDCREALTYFKEPSRFGKVVLTA